MWEDVKYTAKTEIDRQRQERWRSNEEMDIEQYTTIYIIKDQDGGHTHASNCVKMSTSISNKAPI